MSELAEASAEQDLEGSAPVFTIDHGRAVVRLNRPKHRNRIEAQDISAMLQMLDRVERDGEIRVLVLTGTGPVFSAGYHLGEIGAGSTGSGNAAPASDAAVARDLSAAPDAATRDASEVAAGQSYFERLTNTLENVRTPTICRLNGSVYGGATDLALACDFRIGIPGIEMVMPAARLGLHYYRSGIVRYVSRLGLGAAKKLFLTADKIDADEMLRIGYLDEIVAAPELDARVDALAERLVSLAPLAVCGMKRTLNETARGALDAAAADARYQQTRASDDFREGVAAFRGRRKPVFKGR